ncbi:unnamed protein product [Parascedosporium putredinis]|uniref:RING-type domain-containing protein n=1 Tax=Parascedosporium putredinis TaxID=1442378 RepID=A0A9P1H174_9PEZI|nr:unnamed protein product [Parascedosporium putredinis]CAI7993465.1 unnamed protein product [Parascedosporium putredinis]
MEDGLESELICSICSSIFYQPLALLDCLHTFCGSCVKTWFEHQGQQAQSRNILPAFTCPMCREEVRGTTQHARVSSLIDYFLAQHPEKARSDQDKQEADDIYHPGDQVIPIVTLPAPEQGRRARGNRRLARSMRTMSPHEVDSGQSSSSGDFDDDESDSGTEIDFHNEPYHIFSTFRQSRRTISDDTSNEDTSSEDTSKPVHKKFGALIRRFQSGIHYGGARSHAATPALKSGAKGEKLDAS